MSKIKAALITAVLASSTAAMASPSLSFSASARVNLGASISGPIVRDHRGDSWSSQPANPMPSTTWISLAAPLRLANGRDVIRPQLGTYSQVRLQSESGMTYIQKVTVRFNDGTVQTKTFNQWLTNRNAMLQFDLPAYHRPIDSITVQGTATGRGASYEVFAQGSHTISLPRPPVPTDGYHVGGGYLPEPAPYVRPVSLGIDMSFLGTDGRRFFDNVGDQSLGKHTLRLQGDQGQTFIQMVKVTFTNGQEQFLSSVDKTLLPGQIVDLPLDGDGALRIQQICVWTSDNGQRVTADAGTFNASLL
jgi:hypothetical protein